MQIAAQHQTTKCEYRGQLRSDQDYFCSRPTPWITTHLGNDRDSPRSWWTWKYSWIQWNMKSILVTQTSRWGLLLYIRQKCLTNDPGSGTSQAIGSSTPQCILINRWTIAGNLGHDGVKCMIQRKWGCCWANAHLPHSLPQLVTEVSLSRRIGNTLTSTTPVLSPEGGPPHYNIRAYPIPHMPAKAATDELHNRQKYWMIFFPT